MLMNEFHIKCIIHLAHFPVLDPSHAQPFVRSVRSLHYFVDCFQYRRNSFCFATGTSQRRFSNMVQGNNRNLEYQQHGTDTLLPGPLPRMEDKDGWASPSMGSLPNDSWLQGDISIMPNIEFTTSIFLAILWTAQCSLGPPQHPHPFSRSQWGNKILLSFGLKRSNGLSDMWSLAITNSGLCCCPCV